MLRSVRMFIAGDGTEYLAWVADREPERVLGQARHILYLTATTGGALRMLELDVPATIDELSENSLEELLAQAQRV